MRTQAIVALGGLGVYCGVCFGTQASQADCVCLAVIYLAFIVAPVLCYHHRIHAAQAVMVVGMSTVWACDSPILRGVYAFASLMFAMRCLRLFLSPQMFAHYSVWQFVAFVHCYHDLRATFRRPRWSTCKDIALLYATYLPVVVVCDTVIRRIYPLLLVGVGGAGGVTGWGWWVGGRVLVIAVAVVDITAAINLGAITFPLQARAHAHHTLLLARAHCGDTSP